MVLLVRIRDSERFMRYGILVLLAVLLLLYSAAAAESRDITESCRYTATVDQAHARRVATDDYNTMWVGTGGALTVTLPAGEQACGIQLSFFQTAVPVTVEALDASGAVTGQALYAERFLNAYIPLCSDSAYRVSAAEPETVMNLNRVQVFAGEGIPADAQTWHEPEGPMDLL